MNDGQLKAWLAGNRNVLVMLTAVLVLGMAEELWSRFIPKYLEVLGATAWIIAIYGTLKDFLDAVYQYPGGWLADRIGRKTRSFSSHSSPWLATSSIF